MPSPTPNLAEFTDADLIENLAAARADKKAAELALKKINNEILNRKDGELQALLKAKPEPYGTVNLTVAGRKVKFDFKKKVVWSQPELEKVVEQIRADGGVVADYVKVAYEVPESKWKAWGDNIRAYFKDARTVSMQSVSISLDDGEEE